MVQNHYYNIYMYTCKQRTRCKKNRRKIFFFVMVVVLVTTFPFLCLNPCVIFSSSWSSCHHAIYHKFKHMNSNFKFVIDLKHNKTIRPKFKNVILVKIRNNNTFLGKISNNILFLSKMAEGKNIDTIIYCRYMIHRYSTHH